MNHTHTQRCTHTHTHTHIRICAPLTAPSKCSEKREGVSEAATRATASAMVAMQLIVSTRVASKLRVSSSDNAEVVKCLHTIISERRMSTWSE
jgi:hypothetical protein